MQRRAWVGQWFRLLLLLCAIAAPGVGRAQCNNSNPAQPTAAQTSQYSNQSFGNPPPFELVNAGLPGCPGHSRDVDHDGDPGLPGQPSGGLTNTSTNITITGANIVFPWAGLADAAGGSGGNGGDAGNPAFVDNVTGGAGGSGGSGGPVSVTFSGSVGPASNGALGVIGLLIGSSGGGGGNGGSTGTCCNGDKTGGNGGSGGNASSVLLGGIGSATAQQRTIVVESLGGNGGNGGSVSTSDVLNTLFGGQGANGGAGGSATLNWQSGTISAGQQGLFVASMGGAGGAGGNADHGDQNNGGNGASGGNGGNAGATLAGGLITLTETSYDAYNAGLAAVSEGGTGGAGGSGGALVSVSAGNGGNGGVAGAASASVNGNIAFTGLGQGPGHAIFVASAGGQGGAGGSASAGEGQSGGGGYAGAAGSATLTIGTASAAPTITGTGKYANTAVAQSIGGGGGQGGVGGFLVGGGAGAPGGDAANVTASVANGVLLTHGASASGLIAQSIGGGGGVGGDSDGIDVGVDISIGGNGGLGGNGAGVSVDVGSDAIIGSMNVLGDNGVLAQSVGGSGGAGGSAAAKGSGLISMTIGGDAGGGGTAGAATITSIGLITSYGDHAVGLQAQSVGGGGGKGGAAVSFDVGVVPTVSVAIGGRGGSGGPAGTASASSAGQVTTYGSDAWGIVAQSIGGGGGSGGTAAARAVSIAPSESFPAISVSVALGGAGGSGNTGAAATATNTGIVTTAGEGAYALVAQSIGGGGGIGGDSTAASYSGGNSPGLSVSFALAVGGSGGTGATSGTATVDNQGLLLTYGADAYGVFAQSVGGGGGAGGTGDSSAASSKASASFSASLAIGGTGGTGGHGGLVGAGSSGGINTNGDGADGLFAQSVGGGGGAGGGGIGAANGGNLAISVGLGGSGGAGGDGGSVTAANSGAIVTRGTDAVGLLAQSVGGGGGKGGKAGATSGGANPVSNATKLFDTLAGGLNLGASVTQPIDGIFKIAKLGYEAYSAANELYAVAQQLAGGPYQIGSAVKIGVGVAIGGKGGAAGDGGDVTATNTGQISNFGAQSDGIFAQSIGGGGGKGGAATSTDTATNDTKTQLAIGGGGSGGAGGDGGSVTVNNASGALVQTQGVLGFGIFGQSVGGGGGTGGVAGTVAGSLVSLSISIGGDGGSQGTGGAVSLTNAGTVTTSGKHGIGIFAQSIGGGGGLARSMTTNETFDPADIANNPQGRLGDIHGVTLSFNGSTNTTGNAGTAAIAVSGTVTTGGRTAHALVAQSIGGGGGAAVGGLVTGGGNTGTGNGDGDTVTITTASGAAISTAGDGAYGIIAQSIGGGGGLAGSFADVTGVAALAGGTSVIKAGTGDGGKVAITLTGTRIGTAGKLAPALYAQSLGGGGGLIGQGSALYSGGAGGSGSGDTVTVTLVGTTIAATGIQSPGIVIQTNGSGGAAVSIDAHSAVSGGAIDEPAQTTLAGAIYILQGSGNTITNAGTITGAGNLNATAILSDAAVAVTNSGTITGAVTTGGSGSVFTNAAGGVFNPGAVVALGSGGRLINAGTLVIGGTGSIGTTQLTGDLASTGLIAFDADFAGSSVDQLRVSGTASLAGSIAIAPRTMRNTRLALVSAGGGLTLAAQLAALPAANALFAYRFDNDGTTLYATPQAQFTAQAQRLGGAQRAVAGHLQALFDSGVRFDSGFTALANLADAQEYGRALDSLNGNLLGAMAAQRYQSSRRFVSDVIDACTTEPNANCLWARGLAGRSTQDATPESFGYQAQFQLAELGGQFAIADRLYLAGALAYEHSALQDDGDTATINGDSLLAAIGLHYRAGPLEIVGSIDASYGWFDSQRQIAVGSIHQSASAAPQLWSLGVALAASYRLPLGAAGYLKPFAAARGTNVHSDGFAEAGGSAFALDVLAQSDFAASGTLGAVLGSSFALGSGAARLEPFVIAAVEFAGNTDWTTSARFIGENGASTPFEVITRAPGTFARFGIGAELIAGPDFALTLSYNPEFGSNYTTQQGIARLTWRF